MTSSYTLENLMGIKKMRFSVISAWITDLKMRPISTGVKNVTMIVARYALCRDRNM